MSRQNFNRWGERVLPDIVLKQMMKFGLEWNKQGTKLNDDVYVYDRNFYHDNNSTLVS
jgi:hypothetical protein